MKNLHELFIHELSVMYDAEKQIARALPSLEAAASSPKLKKLFTKDMQEVQEQIKRLENISRELGKEFSLVTSEVMQALLKEADKVIASGYEELVKDAALINCAQHVEHFEIASYGILKSLAKSFHYDEICELLEQSSKEEGEGNKALTEVAEGSFFNKGINVEALKKRAA